MRAWHIASLVALGAFVASACGLEAGGPGGDADAAVDAMNGDGGMTDGTMTDGTMTDGGPDAPSDTMDFDIPDLGTGETESGAPCACVPPIPNGYTVLAYAPATRPMCPTGYGTQKDLVEGPTAAASTCSCTCNANPSQQPTCACGANPASFSLGFANGNTCGNSTDKAAANLANGCNNASKAYSSTANGLDWMKATPDIACTPSGGTCAGPTKKETFPAASASQGRSCDLAAALGSCMTGVCVPIPTAGYSVCVSNGTLDPCPVDFPIDHLAGTAIADTRSCGPNACTCGLGGTTCGTPQLQLFDKMNCNGNDLVASIPADGSCKQVNWGNNKTVNSARYAVPVSGATCSFAGSFTPQGGLDVTGGARICCR